ncbi:sphingosine kinase 1-like [Hypanus sabinus]|uniref:sphingosine kinase 1-like n=1 Tax=Hypanus sabinus TaxID=79690 RepID=UPI0028C49CAB|nr:sphingosine kinase 1-like [Hypanus sabinus]
MEAAPRGGVDSRSLTWPLPGGEARGCPPPPPPLPPGRALLHGEVGGGGDGGQPRYALTLTREALHVRRLGPRAEQERRLVLPLRHVLGCRRRRGEGGDGAAAHFSLSCYLPRRGLVGAGRGCRRVLKTFRVDDGAGAAENRARADRWVAGIRCLLLGIDVPAEEEITLSLLPRPRRFLLLVNPRSGQSLGMQYCHQYILPMISEADVSYNLVRTEYQNHAKELVQEISLSEWDGIVIVSGDGLLHEVINGLMARPDWEQAIKMPLGVIPAGSGNALAASINHHAGNRMATGEELLQNCILLLCRGCPTPMDLVSVTTSSGQRLFSFLSVAWGFVADVDLESERYRRLGPARFTLGTLVRLASLRRYRARLSYLPAPPGTPPSTISTPPPHRGRRPLCRSVTADGGHPTSHPALCRTLSEAGGWLPPSPYPSAEGFSFEGVSFQEEEEEGFNSDQVSSEGLNSIHGGEGLVNSTPVSSEGVNSITKSFGLVNLEGVNSSPVSSEGVNSVSKDASPERVNSGAVSSEGVNPAHRGPGGDCSPHERAAGPSEAGEGTPSGGTPRQELPPDHLLAPLDCPVPGGWRTLEGDFVLVLAVYQSHLGSELVAAPFARFADRALHLLYVRAGLSRASLLRLFLAMGTGTHLSLGCPHLTCLPVSAFRLEPLGPRPGALAVDGERVEGGPVQAQLHPGLARVIAGVPPPCPPPPHRPSGKP